MIVIISIANKFAEEKGVIVIRSSHWMNYINEKL